MVLKLYSVDASPPVRAVYLTAAALGIELELIKIDLSKQEQLKPDYLKLNPQHTVPTLDDDGKIIWDSHAIMIYLLTKYGKDKNNSLYPEDHFTRAIIHQRLHFDSGLAFPAFGHIVMPIFSNATKIISEAIIDETVKVYEILEKFLEGKKWVACDHVTIADFSLLSTITTLDSLIPINGRFPNIVAWIKRGEELPYYHVNEGSKICSIYIKKIINAV